MEKNYTHLKQRNCTDSLPFICKTEGQKAIITYVETCLFHISQTSSPSMKIQLFSTRSDYHASAMSDTRGATRKTTSDNNNASTISYLRDMAIQSSSSTESVTFRMTNKSLFIGMATGAAVMVFIFITIIIIRKRLKRTKKNENCFHTTVYDNKNEQNIDNNQIEAPHSQAISVNVTLEANKNNVYDMINKNKQITKTKEVTCIQC